MKRAEIEKALSEIRQGVQKVGLPAGFPGDRLGACAEGAGQVVMIVEEVLRSYVDKPEPKKKDKKEK